MIVVDLFSGAGGWSQAFAARGHTVITVDNESWFSPDICKDVRKLKPRDLPTHIDVLLASPPCEGFSIAAVRWNFRDGEIKRGSQAARGVELVRSTVLLVSRLKPTFFLIENPLGMLRTLDLLPYERRTITQCQYGGERQKPTDLWGGFPPSLKLKPSCKKGSPCHAPGPRGAYGLQKTYEKWKRAMIPEELSLAACRAAERDLKV